MNEPTQKMIEMPKEVRKGLPEVQHDLASVAFGDVVPASTERNVSRDYEAGRFAIPPVEAVKEGGIPIDFPGHDTYSRQAPSAINTVGNKERPTEIDHEEV